MPPRPSSAARRQIKLINQLIMGWPSLLVVIAFFVAYAWADQSQAKTLRERYRSLAVKAYGAEDWDTARMCLLRLSGLRNEAEEVLEPELVFNLANLELRRGNESRAYELVSQIASVSAPGYKDGHLWMIEMLRKRQLRTADEAVQIAKEIYAHLKHAVTLDPKNYGMAVDLSILARQLGEREEARKVLQNAAPNFPRASLALASMWREDGNEKEAVAEANRGIIKAESDFQADSGNLDKLLQVAAYYMFLQRFDEARDLLKTRIGEKSVQQAMAQVYVAWFDSTDSKQIETRLLLLQNALGLDANNEQVILRYMAFSQASEKRDEVYAALEKLLIEGKFAATVHLILGTMYGFDKNSEKAEFHLRQANQANTSSPIILNNLAWILVNKDEPDLHMASTLSEEAVAKMGQHPEVRETRGLIYLKQKKYSEAIADFEYALGILDRKKQLHLWLAECYRALSKEDLAKQHESSAAESPK